MYNLLVFISKKLLQSLYIKDQRFIPVSIDGNIKISYESERDFSRLEQAIEETFNVDELSQTELNVVIVNCSAENKYVDGLYRLFSSVKAHSVVRAEFAIPYVISLSGNFEIDENNITVSLLDSYYNIKKNNNVLVCSATYTADSYKTISPELFSFLFTCKTIKKNEENNTKIISELEEKIENLEKNNNDLLKAKEKALVKQEEYKEKYSSLLSNEDKYKKELNEYKLLEKRDLLFLEVPGKTLSNLESQLSHAMGSINRIAVPVLIKRMVTNGNNVKKGEEILRYRIYIREYYSRPSTKKELVKTCFQSNSIERSLVASKSGRVYLLDKKIRFIVLRLIKCVKGWCDCYFSDNLLQGVIVDNNDQTKEVEIMNWLDKQKYKNRPMWMIDPCLNCSKREYYKCSQKKQCESKTEMGIYEVNDNWDTEFDKIWKDYS